jgi:hypothetical protein
MNRFWHDFGSLLILVAMVMLVFYVLEGPLPGAEYYSVPLYGGLLSRGLGRLLNARKSSGRA